MGSLFDGIGGFPYAGIFYGIRPLWASEILPECISVTQRHFPTMEHLGDITQIKGGDIPPVDIITFGSPCQGLSLAGKRRGLADQRSGLFKDAVRIIYEMKEATHDKYPRFILWENVPGALSSAGGCDYQAVLEALTKSSIPMPGSGRWANAGMVRSRGTDLAWCVYNAQYFGTAQRRRRVFLVADFGGKCAGQILFRPKSLSEYFEAGRIPGQRTAAFDESYVGRTGTKDGTLMETTIQAEEIYCFAGNIINRQPWNGGKCMGYGKNIAYTLTATDRHAIMCLRKQPEKESSSYFEKEEKNNGMQDRYVVRLFTPMECERLQGFPDGWTTYGMDGGIIPDYKRYQMLGNSIAVPCVAYILQGIKEAMREGK